MYLRPVEVCRPAVLVIDGSATIRNGIESALSRRGLRIFSASGPQKIQAAVQEKRVDLVLADLIMSGRDRNALIAGIRRVARRSIRAVPIVAMSERRMWEDLEIFSAADAIGATAVLRKPFSAATLMQLLESLLESAAERGSATPPKPPFGSQAVADRRTSPWSRLQ